MTETVKCSAGMNPKIKERIEQIRQGIVPEGYKKTKVGIIPEEWEVTQLGEMGEIFRGKGIPKSKLTDAGNSCVLYGELYTKYHNVITSLDSKTDKQTAEKSFKLEYGDILFTGSGEKAEEIGKAAIYLIKDESAYAGGDLIVLRPKTEIRNKVYGYLLNTEYVNKQKYKKAQGHSVVHIYGDNIKKLYVPFIPVNEQQQIAEILSTWDRAIVLKEALIKEKEEQKKGLMQLVLSNDNQYKIVKLGEISETSSGGTPKRTISEYYNGNIPWVVISDITSSGKYLYDTATKITKKGLENSSAKLYPKNVILYAIYASIGECTIAKEKVSSNQAILCIDLNKDKADLEYVYYYLYSIKDKIKLKGQQGTQSNLNAGMVRNLNIPLPSLSKQKQISTQIATADLEIVLLNKELELLKEQKKGLMQLLLTGIVRVGEVGKLE